MRTPATDTLLQRLAPIFGERLRTDEAARQAAGGDESGLAAGLPDAVVFPVHTEEVVALAREASAQGVALVARGAGTGKAGACIADRGEVVVDFSRMNRILELRPEDMYIRVEPGVITQAVGHAAAEAHLFYPPNPGSFESCTIGGNIATNAGGSHAVKYGVTQRYVWGLEVVLASGEQMRVGRQSLKGVAGYDLTSLLVGSEGTLALITGATLQLVPAPDATETAWLSFPSMEVANAAAARIFASGIQPSVLEVMDRISLDIVRPVAPFSVPEGAGAAILAECDGAPQHAADTLLRLCEVAVEAGATDTAIASRERHRESMRRTRRLVSSTLKERVPFKISDDIAVPRSRMAEVLTRAQALGDAVGITVSAYGHLGDGNLHVNLHSQSRDEQREAERLRRDIIGVVLELGGTITGEHGIGIAKRELLALEQPSALLRLQERLKASFDPKGILNPGKLFPPAEEEHGAR